MKKVLLSGCVLLILVFVLLLAISWGRAEAVVERVLADPLTEISIAESKTVSRYLRGHWFYRSPWNRLSDERTERLIAAAIALASREPWLFGELIECYKDDPVKWDSLIPQVINAVETDTPGAAKALHESRALLDRPKLDELELVRIIRESDCLGLIVVLTIAYDPDEIRAEREAYLHLLRRHDVPERVRNRVAGILEVDLDRDLPIKNGTNGPNGSRDGQT